VIDQDFKKHIISAHLQKLQQKIAVLTDALSTVEQATYAEERSSMGDKYETTLARLQQEQQQLQTRLDSAHQLLQDSRRMLQQPSQGHISAGSLFSWCN